MRSASFEVALFIIRTYAAVFFNATALCRGTYGSIYKRSTLLSFDATALCRGHSRWLCVARQKQT
jgi:hypothetical protein